MFLLIPEFPVGDKERWIDIHLLCSTSNEILLCIKAKILYALRAKGIIRCECESENFPEALLKSFTSTLAIDDILNDESLTNIDKQSFTAMGYRGLAVATVRKGENNPLWSIVAVSGQPRHWTIRMSG